MSVEYRPFSLNNIKDIVSLGRQMHEETRFRSVPFDMERTAQSAYDLVIQNDNGFGLVAYKGGKPIGLFAGLLENYYFGPATIARDFAWYVLPGSRGSTAGIRLLKSFEKWAKSRGAHEIYIGVSTNLNSDSTGKMLERMGYTHVGCNYTQLLS